jgi:hypothetical protein
MAAEHREAALGKGVIGNQQAMSGSILPWGRGEKMRRPEEDRSRRSYTVHMIDRRRKTRYGGFSNKYFRTQVMNISFAER